MAKSKSAVKRKRRAVAKHIQKANEAKVVATTTDGDGGEGEAAPPSTKPTPATKDKHTKPPAEAHNYLILWSTSRGEWKFNKNTQSWLIRHMYDANLVGKAAFGVMLDYLATIKGGGIRERVVAEAVGRCRWYKLFGADEKDNNSKDEEKVDEAIAKEMESLADDHEQRKTYKRARRILDALKDLID